MSLQMEHRGFTIGRQVGGCGRWARFVLGLLGLAYIGVEVAHLGPSAALIERLAGGLLLTTALYLAVFWLLGERVSQPWLRTVIFWLPAVFILLPEGWGLGVLLYWSVACLVTALVSYGGCEVVALPSLLFRRYYTVYCPLNAIDLIERRYTRTGNGAQDQG
jgi:uncharacterized protein DUF6410